MGKIVQFSTIGALMSGYFSGEFSLHDELSQRHAFGLGCSDGANGELTIFNGVLWEATADEELHNPDKHEKVPFVQITSFRPEKSCDVENISHENAEQLLGEEIRNENIFLAICIEARFDKLVIRRPRRAGKCKRTVREIVQSQQVDTLYDIHGKLIGFWTPELFGRISVPGFHFHFINKEENISGHVLEYYASKGIMQFEEKQTIEITVPLSDNYKNININIPGLDKIIHQVEK
jgi:acetolactate decarboxylase